MAKNFATTKQIIQLITEMGIAASNGLGEGEVVIRAKYVSDKDGQALIAIGAETNIPTKPVDADAKTGWFRRKSVDWDGEMEFRWTTVSLSSSSEQS